MNNAFPHEYEAIQLFELPSTALSPHYYYPGALLQGGRDGVLLEVRPKNGQSWLGTFAFGQIAPTATTGMFSMPNPQHLCVVAKGQGYLVSAESPTSWELIRGTPITDVCPVPSRGMILFADYTHLIAYDSVGKMWETKRLAWDSLKITELTDSSVRGEYWDIQNEAIGSFVVDLDNGKHKGGMQEPL